MLLDVESTPPRDEIFSQRRVINIAWRMKPNFLIHDIVFERPAITASYRHRGAVVISRLASPCREAKVDEVLKIAGNDARLPRHRRPRRRRAAQPSQ